MRSRIVAVLLALAATGAAADMTVGGSPAPPRVVVHGDRVTATLTAAPLSRVLAEIARQTGAELAGEAIPPRDITADLHRVPLEEALQRLLGARSFTLTYARDGNLKRILIGGVPSESVAAAAVTTPRPTGPGGAGATGRSDEPQSPDEKKGGPEDFRRVHDFLNGDSPVPVRGHLAETLGTSLAPFRDVWQAALANEDRRVRAQARRASIRALTADPEVHESWVATTLMAPDDVIVKLLRTAGGLDARELAIAFARYGRSNDIARTMRRALDQMRTPPTSPTGG